jgi:hypothetical protein
MAGYVDWFNVMTYDYAGSWNTRTGHNAPLYDHPSSPTPGYSADTTVRAYLGLGVPAGKVVLGVPLYGVGFKEVTTNQHGLFQPCGGAGDEGSWEAGKFDFRDLAEGTRGHAFIDHGGYGRYWDGVSKVPYLFNPAARVFISYDDEASVACKVGYALSNGLAGVMFWSMDADGSDACLQAVMNRLCHPFRHGIACGTDGTARVTMSWYALTGQTYAVEFRADLRQGGWTECRALLPDMGMPTGRIAGAGLRVTVSDADFSGRTGGFYRIRMVRGP